MGYHNLWAKIPNAESTWIWQYLIGSQSLIRWISGSLVLGQVSICRADEESTALAEQAPFRFLDLPREIRDNIYELLCHSAPQRGHDYTKHCLTFEYTVQSYHIGSKSGPKCSWMNILLLDKQISEEFMDVLYGGMPGWFRDNYHGSIGSPVYTVACHENALQKCPAAKRHMRMMTCELDYDTIVASQENEDGGIRMEEEIERHLAGAEMLTKEIFATFDKLRILRLEIKPPGHNWPHNGGLLELYSQPVDSRLLQAMLPFLELDHVKIELEGDLIGLPNWQVQLFDEHLLRLRAQRAETTDAAQVAKLDDRMQHARAQKAKYLVHGPEPEEKIDYGHSKYGYKVFYYHLGNLQNWNTAW